ncbi:MAG: ABC transporter permease, partial [Candidatus Atribacteria bacterium]|nr:ABC transporter permease [Candidatus Atribacteria bacterium]
MNTTSPLKRKSKSFPFLGLYGAFVYFYLYFPLLVVFVYSLNSSRSTMKFEGITFDWYMRLFHNKELLSSLFHSLQVSGLAVIFAVVVGTSGALFLNRIEFKGKDFFRMLAMLPIILPGIIVGLSLLIFFLNLKLQLSMWTVILGHMSFTTPVVMFQVLARLARLSRNLENAAMDLGANPFQAFIYVTFPMIKRAVIGGALLAFTMSFDEIIITYFLTSTFNTLPIYLYGMLRFGLSPEVYAISTVVLGLSILLIIL